MALLAILINYCYDNSVSQLQKEPRNNMKTIYYNGQVYTGQLPLVEAFAVEDGHFSFVGSTADALALATGEDCCIDLKNKFVCAGFNDSHMHLLSYGNALNMAPLHEHTGSLEDLIQCLKNHKNSRSGWVLGRGWNQDYFSDVKRMPNRWDLDRVSTTCPVVAVRACGHALAVNSYVLELLGISGDTPQPDGGQIVMENGIPNGLLLDTAMDPVYAAIPSPSREDLKDMILLASQKLNGYGITSSQSDDYCVFPDISWREVNAAFQELEAEKALTVRVNEQCNFTNLHDLQTFVEAGNNTGVGSPMFRIGPLKMLGDGALGARTAFLSQPYADEPDTCGIAVFTQDVLDSMIGYAHAHGMQVAVHAIGDACLDRVIGAIEKAQAAHPRTDHRHGIVHCQITRADQLEKMAEMALHIYAQTIFLDYDIQIVEQRVGQEMASTSYSWKTVAGKGASVSNGSDCPVELPNVLGGIQCAVTRCTLDGKGPYLPDEAFSIAQALNSFTSGGAYASFEEHIKGEIKPGMLADFVVLGENPFAVAPSAIKDIPVCATYLGGRMVYSA